MRLSRGARVRNLAPPPTTTAITLANPPSAAVNVCLCSTCAVAGRDVPLPIPGPVFRRGRPNPTRRRRMGGLGIGLHRRHPAGASTAEGGLARCQ